MDKREMNIPRQWDKRVMGKGSPHYAKYKSLYTGEGSRENLSKSELERAIRNLSTEAKISLLQPELAKAKKEVSEQSLLSPALGDDMDSLPDDPWFSKSPEEKYEDVIQEEHGQYENAASASGLPSFETEFVGEHEGEEEGALAANNFLSGATDYHDYDDPSSFLDISKKDEGGSALDLMGEEHWDPRIRGRTKGEYSPDDPQDKLDISSEPSTWDSIKGFFSSDDDGGYADSEKPKGLSSNQKIAAGLIKDIFGEKEERQQQSIGASPLTPGRALDMSRYSSARPKKDRYRNMGLLGRA
jgi:hypothetical protein